MKAAKLLSVGSEDFLMVVRTLINAKKSVQSVHCDYENVS